MNPQRVDELTSTRGTRAFPAEADRFFRVETIAALTTVTLEAGYSVLISVAGAGELSSGDSPRATSISRGQTVLVPYSAGPVTLTGDGLVVIQARPPAWPTILGLNVTAHPTERT